MVYLCKSLQVYQMGNTVTNIHKKLHFYRHLKTITSERQLFFKLQRKVGYVFFLKNIGMKKRVIFIVDDKTNIVCWIKISPIPYSVSFWKKKVVIDSIDVFMSNLVQKRWEGNYFPVSTWKRSSALWRRRKVSQKEFSTSCLFGI